jgi:hypothetical protein
MARSTSSPLAAPGTAVHAVPERSLAFHLLLALRPAQLIKSLVISAGLLFGKRLGLTIPFPLYGVFRYLYLVHQRKAGASPADLLLTDRPLVTCAALSAHPVVLISTNES